MSSAAYDYRDAGGGYLFSVVKGDGKRFLQGVRQEDGAYVWNLDGIAARPLYRLPELAEHLGAGRREPVYVVEGEKDVEQGDLELSILEAAGELRHWSEGRGADRASGREDVAGLYYVGGASLDLSDVRPLEVALWGDDHLAIRLDERTTLHVVEQAAE
jgi:hypothetical protein